MDLTNYLEGEKKEDGTELAGWIHSALPYPIIFTDPGYSTISKHNEKLPPRQKKKKKLLLTGYVPKGIKHTKLSLMYLPYFCICTCLTTACSIAFNQATP